MAAITEFEPLVFETVDTIRARVDANVNAGLDATDPRWQDVVPGGFFSDHMQAVALELEGVYDYVSVELPASFFLQFSWGIYLDYWGDMLTVPRNPAATAAGVVTLSNDTAADINAPVGVTEVAVPATDPDADPLTYTLTEGVVVPAGGSVDATIAASDTGSVYNVAATAITVVTSLSGLTVTNAAPVTGGADEELDEPYKARLLLEFTGTRGGGTEDDYRAWFLAQPGVGYVSVEPLWNGPGTVRVVIADTAGNPFSSAQLDAFEAAVTPDIPIDATLTLATVTPHAVPVAASIVPDAGFSLDGAAGTEPLRDALDAALQAFNDALVIGEDVRHNQVLRALLNVRGVIDVSALTLDGTTGDVAIGALEKPALTMPPTFS